MLRFFSILSTIFISQIVFAETSNKPVNDSLLNHAINCIKNHIITEPDFLLNDSVFIAPLQTILNFYSDSSIQKNITTTRNYISKTHPAQTTALIQTLTDTLINRKQRFNEQRALLRYKDTLNYNTDSINILNDSINTDSLSIGVNHDTLNYKNFCSDTLIQALNLIFKAATNDSNLNWINQLRNDTTLFFISNSEGDSLQLKLYPDNPDVLRINITDFWGTKYPAVIRDINQNSFRLLLNNAPDFDNSADKKALDNLLMVKHLGYELIFEKRQHAVNIKPWVMYGNSNFDASQMVLHQWAKGGESSISFLSGLELYAKYKKNKHSLDSYAKLKLGLIRQGDYNNDSTAFFKTNEDRIDIQTKYGYQILKNYSMSALLNFKSQFAPSYDYTDTTRTMVSKFMNPAYLTFALGLDYINGKRTTAFFSPLTAKTTLVLRDNIDETKYGIEAGQMIRYELGAIFKASNKIKIWGNIAMENSLELFSNYMDNPQNIDVDWEFKLILPVNDFVRATISTQLIYDDDEKITKRKSDGSTYESKGIQLKEMLSIGFFMKF